MVEAVEAVETVVSVVLCFSVGNTFIIVESVVVSSSPSSPVGGRVMIGCCNHLESFW